MVALILVPLGEISGAHLFPTVVAAEVVEITCHVSANILGTVYGASGFLFGIAIGSCTALAFSFAL